MHNNSVKPDNCRSTGFRPDIVLPSINVLFKVIIEVDENQHSGYKKLCESSVHKELSRLISIYENDFGGEPLVIIRFNPDKYKSDVQHGMVKRFSMLRNLLRSLRNKTSFESLLMCYYLYYDGFTGIAESPIKYELKDGALVVDHKHPKYEEIKYIIKL